MILIGTSGYTFDDWVGPFYPPGTKRAAFLDYYQEHFITTELNFTYYRMPTADMLARMGDKVPSNFLFSVKTPGDITHQRANGDPRPEVQQFNAALAGLKEQGKFACALAQFPYSFHATDENRLFLRHLKEGFETTRVVIEFRNRNWLSQDTFDLLEELDLGFCCVDQPQFSSLLPPIAIATSSIAYARFHGRNYQKWWHHDEAWERYDYAYNIDEFAEWVPRLKKLDESPDTELTLVYLNNHWEGQAPASAHLLAGLLIAAGAAVC